jgi:uncharacterized Zn finger protein
VDDLAALEETASHSPLQELICDLTCEQLRDLVLQLAARHPGLAKEMVHQVALLRTSSREEPETGEASPSPLFSAVELRSLRRQVTATLRSLTHMRPSEAYWHVGSVVSGVRELLARAVGLVERGDGNNALLVLEAITDEYVEGWLNLDDSDGYASGFFAELGSVWLDAALAADLSLAQRQQWADRLTGWLETVAGYGVDDVFDAAQAAFLHGWDYDPLRRVLEGAEIGLGSWEEPPPWYTKELTAARLKALERQGRYQAYLHLARASGQTEAYATMLARVGREGEAIEFGLRHLSTPDETLALAQVLLDRGDLEASVRVAEHGLSLTGDKEWLATWLRDLALDAGLDKLALRSAVVAFHSAPSLDGYRFIEGRAGDRWNQLQRGLLDFLRRARSCTSAQVDVFLHEGLLDDAIASVSQGGGYAQIERVMDAVLEHRPDWVIRNALHQAERIIEPGQAKYYHHAVAWLERARDAYHVAGREAEWKAFLRDLRERHGRKYKLMGMLGHL